MDLSRLSCRPLKGEDAEPWLELRREGVRDFPDGFLLSPAEADAMGVAQAQDLLGFGAFRGLYLDQSLIGFCAIRRLRRERLSHRAELGPFFVRQAYHGTGAADVMMREVLSEARGMAGLRQVELSVAASNGRAQAFYNRHGFARVALHPGAVMIDGVAQDDVLMQYILPEASP
ncbi:MAG: GNAT family N-acetyltransferase [Pseudomonadota bacterium]